MPNFVNEMSKNTAQTSFVIVISWKSWMIMSSHLQNYLFEASFQIIWQRGRKVVKKLVKNQTPGIYQDM